MTESHDDLSDRLRRITGTPSPFGEERQVALARLQRVISERPAPPPLRARRLIPVGAMILVVLVGLAALIMLRAPQATASLLELAEAARRVDPLTLTPGQAIHATSEVTQLTIIPGEEVDLATDVVAYLLPVTRETWHKEDGSIVIRTTIGTPVFFDPAVEQAYYRTGHDEVDRVGESFEDAFTGVTSPIAEHDWPTDPDSLRSAMRAWVQQGGSPLPEDVQLFQLAGSILRAQPAPPALRGAILEVLATLSVTTTTDSAPETLTTTITYQDDHTTLTEHLTFDKAGYLIADGTTANTAIPELGIPAANTIAEGHYTAPAPAMREDVARGDSSPITLPQGANPEEAEGLGSDLSEEPHQVPTPTRGREPFDVAEALQSFDGLGVLVVEDPADREVGASPLGVVALVADDGSHLDAVTQRLDRQPDPSALFMEGEYQATTDSSGRELFTRTLSYGIQVIAIDSDGLLVNLIVEDINRSDPSAESYMGQFTVVDVEAWALALLIEAGEKGWSR